MNPDDEPEVPANSSFLGVACAIGSVMFQFFAWAVGLGVASQIAVIVIAPAIAVLGIWLSLSARHGRGPGIGGLVTSMAAFVFTGTIAAAALVAAIV